MTDTMTYNKYLSDGIQDGSIKYREVDGVRVYGVRRPKKGEVVMGYRSMSNSGSEETPTMKARVK